MELGTPYFSPAWSRQKSLAEFSLSKFIPGMQVYNPHTYTGDRDLYHTFWDAYAFVQQLMNERKS